MEEQKQSFFTIQCTNIAKGIAILILLFHHLGLNTYLNVFEETSVIYTIAQNFKVCVAIFLILSGYGLNASFNKKFDGKNYWKYSVKFSLRHLLKLLINYWIIFVLFVSFGHFTGIRTIQEVYGENHLIRNVLLDFLGISSPCGTPKYNLTWWFMGLIIVIYISFPIWKIALKKCPVILFVFAVFIYKTELFSFYNSINEYLIYFVVGMLFSEYYLFDKLKEIMQPKWLEIISAILCMVMCFYLRTQDKTVLYNALASLSIIVFGNSVICYSGSLIKKGFEILGKHSSNMFMLHTFLYSYFFADFFMSLKKWYIMYVVLVALSLLISVLIELIKKLVRVTIQKIRKEIADE